MTATAVELIVAVVIVRLWSGRRLGRAAWGRRADGRRRHRVSLLLLTSSSAGGGGDLAARCTGLPAALGAGLAGTAAVAAALAGLRATGARRAVLLALAAGLADSCAAVVTMAFAHVVGHGAGALATSWAGYALVVCGTGNVLLTQTAYQAGRPLVTLPVISSVTPVASVAIAAGMLDELPGHGAAGAVAAGAAVLVTGLALAALARCAPLEPGAAARSAGASAGSALLHWPGEHRADPSRRRALAGATSRGRPSAGAARGARRRPRPAGAAG